MNNDDGNDFNDDLPDCSTGRTNAEDVGRDGDVDTNNADAAAASIALAWILIFIIRRLDGRGRMFSCSTLFLIFCILRIFPQLNSLSFKNKSLRSFVGKFNFLGK